VKWLMFLLVVGGCSTSDSSEDDEPIIQSDVESIRVEPETVTLSTDGTIAGSVRFTAFATTDSGDEVETDMVSWSVSNLSAGDINSRGKFESSTLNGGVTTVTATHVGIEASATVTVVYEQDMVEGELAPAIVSAFDSATPVDGMFPLISYPEDGVTVPRNLEGLAFTWESSEAANVTRLRMQSGITDMSIFTAADVWFSNADVWATIAASNTEGSVDVTIETGTWDGSSLTDVQRGPPFSLTVNRLDARGSVLYWVARADTSGGEPAGDIMRIPFGSTEAETFWTFEDAGQCVGCHTLVEAGEKMVVTHSGVNGNFSIIDISDPDYPETWLGTEEERRATFHAASPDGEFLLTVADYKARLYSLFTGALIMDIDTGGDRVSHPDWSPDGDSILLVRITSTAMNDMNFEGGEIIRMPWNGNSFGAAEVLVPATDDKNNYYPSFSPDGEWIAFNRAVRTEIVRADGSVEESSSSYANPSAELWLMAKDGTYQTRLDTANGVGELQNSFPRWGPLPDDDVLWLAFSSTRSYAVDPNRGIPQIWVTAIEPEKILEGVDPSAAPFWLPAQDSQSDNHLAIWWSK
jgi:WD40 repeat protein